MIFRKYRSFRTVIEKRKPLIFILTSLLTYFFIWAILDLPLLYHCKSRPFLFDADFIAPFFQYIAGPAEGFASLISQLYYFQWIGALAILSILIVIFLTTRFILHSFGQFFILVPLLPAALGLFLLQNHITVFPLLTFAISLSMVVIFIKCKSFSMIFRFGIYIALSALLSFFVGGSVLLFALICFLHEFFIHKKPWLALGFFVLGAIIHFELCFIFFEPNKIFQYFIGAPLEANSLDFHLIEILWYALFPILILGIVHAKYLQFLKKPFHLSFILAFAFMFVIMVNNRFNRYNYMLLDYYTENCEWEKALEYTQQHSDQSTIMTSYIVNYCLYQSGKLPSDMFDYPQIRNPRVLFMEVEDNEPEVFPHSENLRTDVYYQLGRIDQAERWAHEVLTSQGFQGAALRKLISINVLKNRPKAARTYAGVLQKTITHRAEATKLITQFDNGALLANDKEINNIRLLLPKNDYIGALKWKPKEVLEQQLQEAPNNRMAFEYFMAYLLIEGNIMEFGNNVHKIQEFGYKEIPRAYEEACLVYKLSTGQQPPNLELQVRDETVKRFKSFMKLLQKYDKNRSKAWDVLRPTYGNTFWFYKVFERSGTFRPSNFNATEMK